MAMNGTVDSSDVAVLFLSLSVHSSTSTVVTTYGIHVRVISNLKVWMCGNMVCV